MKEIVAIKLDRPEILDLDAIITVHGPQWRRWPADVKEAIVAFCSLVHPPQLANPRRGLCERAGREALQRRYITLAIPYPDFTGREFVDKDGGRWRFVPEESALLPIDD